jgi:hypothetical protein
MAELDLDELRAELEDFAQQQKKAARSPRDERVIAGFEDILRFVDDHGRAPRHGEDRDIFERLYAVRLDRIRAQADCRELVAQLDRHGLLDANANAVSEDGATFLTDDELLAELGGVSGSEDDISTLKHVRPRAEINAAEDVAQRKPCRDFDRFKPLFEAVRRDLKSGARQSRRFREDATVRKGEFFILGGQVVYVAEVPEELGVTEHGHAQGRLRVIYDNATEGDNLLRSFVRALYKDEGGRRITDPSVGPLFGDEAEGEDLDSGTIYVLRSKSDHPDVAVNRELIHKVGVTGGAVQTRIANAVNDATYLLAEVEIVAEYKLFNIDRTKLENLLHRALAPARLDLTIEDRFGRPVQPREWYLVPLTVIDEVVGRVRDGSITEVVYDPATASLIPGVASERG